MDPDLEEQVREANRKYHNSIETDEYQKNPSIFNPERQRDILENLREIGDKNGRLLDVGCGTGNILSLAQDFFDYTIGVDISRNMLKTARNRDGSVEVTETDASRLPFPDASFEAVRFYATLHHSPNPKKFLEEAERILKPGGYLYTDHDPNYYLVRFYFPIFRFMNRGESDLVARKGIWPNIPYTGTGH